MSPMVNNVLVGFQLVINFATVITLLYTLVKFTMRPTDTLKERVDAIELWQKDTDRRLKEGTQHFLSIDEGNAVTQQALLAIMDASISGNNVDELREARTELYEYITKRRKNG